MKEVAKKYILEVVQNTGSFPKISWLAKELGTNEYQTRQILKELVREKFLYMKGNWYYLSKNEYDRIRNNDKRNEKTQREQDVVGGIQNNNLGHIQNEEDVNLGYIQNDFGRIQNEENVQNNVQNIQNNVQNVQNNVQNVQNNVQNVQNRPIFDIAIFSIRFVLFAVGIGAVILSFYFTFTWLADTLPKYIAALVSGIMIGFSSMAFQVIILFVTKQVVTKWYRFLIAAGFLVLWAIVVSFSMLSTVAVQYDEYIKNVVVEAETLKDISVGRTEWALLQEEKSIIETQLEDKRMAYYYYLETSKTQQTGSKAWNDNQWRITLNQREIDKLVEQLKKVRENEKRMLKELPEATAADNTTGRINNFFTWVSTTFNFNQNIFRFVITSFPAVFIDLIAPIALSIAFFLKKKKINPKN